MVSSNHPIPPTSKTRGRWMVYNRIHKKKTHHIPHVKDMYQISAIKEIHNFPTGNDIIKEIISIHRFMPTKQVPNHKIHVQNKYYTSKTQILQVQIKEYINIKTWNHKPLDNSR